MDHPEVKIKGATVVGFLSEKNEEKKAQNAQPKEVGQKRRQK